MDPFPDDDTLPLPIELQDQSVPLASLAAGLATGDVLTWDGFSWVSATPGVPVNGVSGPLTGSTINALSRWSNTDGNMLSNSVITLSDTGVFSSLNSASDVNSSEDFKINNLTVFSTNNTNTFAGLSVGYNITMGVNNVGVGLESLRVLSSGSRNVSLGSTNLTNLTTGNNNISLGAGSATDLTTGSGNIILGTGAVAGNSNAQSRIVLGGGPGIYDNGFHIPTSTKFYFPLLESTTPLSKVLYYDSVSGTIAQGTLTPQSNEFLDSVFRINYFNNPSAQLAFDCSNIASSTTRTLTVPNANTILPVYSASSISTGNLSAVSGNQNTYYGMDVSASSGNQNTAIGYQSAKSNLIGSSNLSVGYRSAYLTTGSNMLSIGNQAGYSNTTGQYNTIVGHQANYTNSTGNASSIYGYQAAYASQTSNVSAFGYQSLYSLTTGSENSAFGYQSLLNNTNGSYNTVFGYNTGKTNISGAGLTAFGSRALEASTGNDNSSFGRNSLLILSTGTNNTAVGSHAGISLTTGSNNTLFGYNATTYSSSTTGSIVVGASVVGKTNFTSTNGNNILTIKTPVANQGAYTNTFRNLPGSFILNYNTVTEEITYVEGGGGGSTFLDDVFRVLNVGDLTKKFAVDCQYVSTASTRTFIIPDVNGILPGLDAQNNLSLGSIVSNITDGTNNTIIGKNAGASITTGTNNVLIGYAVDTNYNNSILLGSSGTADNQIRIGFNGIASLQTNTYIDGIYNHYTAGYIIVAGSDGLLGGSNLFTINTEITANAVFEATIGAQIGYATGTAPPENGLLVAGPVGIGTETPLGTLNVSGTLTDLQTIGSFANSQTASIINNTFQPTTNTNLIASQYIQSTFISPNTFTATNAAGLYLSNIYDENIGTITNAFGVFADSGSAGTGIITNAYGGFFKTPLAGTSKVALYADSLLIGYATITTSASTTTLTNASMTQQFFTGTSTETVVLPVVSTLFLGYQFVISNRSTQSITIQSSGLNVVTVMPANTTLVATCILTTGTTAASWDIVYDGATSTPVTSIIGTPNQIVASAGTGEVTLSLSSSIQTPGTLAVNGPLNGSSKFTVIGPGGTSGTNHILAYLGSGTSATATNLYSMILDKSNGNSLLFGINKNSTTGSIPSNVAFISTYQPSPAGISIGRGDNTGLPSTADIYISSNGNVSIGNVITTSLFNVGSSAQFQINSSGVVSAGTWNGTPVGLQYGGTNNNLLTVITGAMVFCNGTALAYTAAGSSGQVLVSQGTSTPIWSTTTFPTTAGTAGTILRSNGTNIVNSTATFADTYTAGQLLYSNGANNVIGLTGFDAQVLSNSGGNPVWSNALSATVQSNITQVGVITSGTWNGTNIALSRGGTGVNNSVITGAVAFCNSAGITLTAVGTSGQLLQSAGTGTPSWISTLNSTIQDNITRLGTITSGVWNGTIIGLARGGTNSNITVITGAVAFCNSTGIALTAVGTSGQLLQSAATGTPTWTSTLNSTIQTNITQLGVITSGTWNATVISTTYGGTGQNLTGTTNGGVVYKATTGLLVTGNALTGRVLQANGTAAPSFSTAAYPSTAVITSTVLRADGTSWVPSTATYADTYSASSILYSNGANTVVGLTTANNGVLATGGTGIPVITTVLPTTVQGNITTLGTITTGVWSASTIALDRGGTNSNLTVITGAVAFCNSTGIALTAVGISGQLLRSNGTGTPLWTSATYPSAPGTAGTILRSNGADWVNSTATFANTYTASNILYSNGDNTIVGLTTANNGVLATGGTGIPVITTVLPNTVQGNITTLGVITSGTWNAGIISGTYGGTGIDNSTRTITISAGSAGRILASDASGNAAYSTAVYPTTAVITSAVLRSDGTNWVNSSGMTVDSAGYINSTGLGIATASSTVACIQTIGNVSGALIRSAFLVNTSLNSGSGSVIRVCNSNNLNDFSFDGIKWFRGGSGYQNACIISSYNSNLQIGGTAVANSNCIGILDSDPQSNLSIVGNCQIGFASATTAPSNGLIVSGNTYFGTSTSVGNSDKVQIVNTLIIGASASSTTGILRFVSTGSDNYIQSGLSTTSNSAANLIFGTMSNATEWMRLSSTGNLGIACTPTQKLEIGGTSSQIYLNSATSNMIQFNINGTAAPTFTTRSIGTKIVLYPEIGASTADYALGINGGTLWYGVPNTSSLHKWYGGITDWMTLNNSGLGIGATPTQKLEIGGTNAQIYLNSATSNMIQFNINGTAAPTFTTARSAGTKIILYPSFANGTSADHAIGIENNANWYGVPTTSQSHKFYGGITEWMALNTSGLGIGATPSYRLHVRRDATGALGPTFFLENQGGNVGAACNIDVATYAIAANAPAVRIVFTDTGNFSNTINIQSKIPGVISNALTSRIFIDTSGNVCVGNTSASGMFNVGSSNQFQVSSAGAIVTSSTAAIGGSLQNLSQFTSTSTNAYNGWFAGTQTAIDGSLNSNCIVALPTFAPTTGSSSSSCLFVSPQWATPNTRTISNASGLDITMGWGSNLGTITNSYGVRVQLGSGSGGTITNSYGGYFATPAAGTSRVALYADTFFTGYNTRATTGGTTTLTTSDVTNQYFTGTLGQTVVLPVASAIFLGYQYYISNRTSPAAVITVQSSGLNLITTLSGGSTGLFTCITTVGTGASVWDFTIDGAQSASGVTSVSGTTNQITTTGTTVITVSLPSTLVAPGTVTATGNLTANNGFVQTSETVITTGALSTTLDSLIDGSNGPFTVTLAAGNTDQVKIIKLLNRRSRAIIINCTSGGGGTFQLNPNTGDYERRIRYNGQKGYWMMEGGVSNINPYPDSFYPTIQQGTKLVGTGNTGAGRQGSSIALSADGNTLAVGAIADGATAVGATWIYTRSGNIWSQQGTKLIGTGFTGTNIQQGSSVSLSADGNTLAIGATFDNTGIGATWIFTRSGTTWTQQGTKLVGTGNAGTSRQGAVALSSDGNTLAVGGFQDNSFVGAAWIFTRSGTIWTQQGTKLVGTGFTSGSQQGISIAISADGNTIAVGANGDNPNIGATWIFTRSNTTWTQQGTKLVGTGNTGNCTQGSSVALSTDGNTLAVGGNVDNSSIGATWIFTRSGTTWTQQGTKLVGTGFTGTNIQQGASVALSADGNILVSCGPSDVNPNAVGAAWIFVRNIGTQVGGNNSVLWTQQGTKLVGTGTAGAQCNQGFSVSLSSNGNTLALGAILDNTNIGASWVFI